MNRATTFKHVLNGPKKPIKFGVTISEDFPIFEKGEYLFQSRLISQHEERHLAKMQEYFPKAEKDDEGEDRPLTEAQQDQTFDTLCGILADILRPRLLLPAEGEADTFRLADKDEAEELISVQWVDQNTATGEFSDILYFLRNGHMLVSSAEMTPISLGHDDPNVGG